MEELNYREGSQIDQKSLIDLYADAGWTAYTQKPEELVRAIEQSLFVLTAWDQNRLVGLIRVVGDGISIVYVQDILVLKAYKRKRIGKTLMTMALNHFKHVRQKVLLTEDNEETRGFYEALGFESCDKGQLVAYTKL